jgi:ribose transport system substrate-binding protein
MIAAAKKGTNEEPPTTGPTPKKGIKVVYVSCGQQSPGCAAPGEAGAVAAKLLGWSYQIVDGNFNQANGYTVAMRQAISEKPNAIWMGGIDCDQVKVGLEAAKQANIPVLGVLGEDCSDTTPGQPSLFSIKMIYNSQARTTTEWYAQYARLKADYLIAKNNGNVKLVNVAFTDALLPYTEAFDAVIKQCSTCSLVDQINVNAAGAADPNGPVASEFKSDFLRHPDINAVNAPFDTQLIQTGLLQAIKNTPGTQGITVLGGEGLPEGLSALDEGPPLVAEAPYSDTWQGYAAIDTINRYLDGAPEVPEGFGAQIVEKADIGDATSYSPNVNFIAAYKEAWGVK